MQRQPTLLNSCARAATAAEARFRIEYPDVAARTSLVVALDERAGAVVRRLADRHWSGGRFLIFDEVLTTNGMKAERADAFLRTTDGSKVLLSDELGGADVAVLVATEDVRAEAASVIGDACAARRTMSAALVVSPSQIDAVDEAVSVLRPNAMVMLVLRDERDVSQILAALRV